MSIRPLLTGWDSQPQESVGIDWSNPLTRGLVFASIGAGPDLVTGTLPSFLGGGRIGVNRLGLGAESSSTSTDGVFYALPPSSPVYSIGTQSTIALNVEIDAWANYSTFLCVPYRSAGWTSPFSAFQFGRIASTDEIFFQFAEDSTFARNGLSTTFSVAADGSSRFLAASRNGTSVTLQDNATWQTVSIPSGTTAPHFVNRRPLVLLNHSDTSAGEGIDGRNAFAYVWNRALSNVELDSIRENPWQLFAPRSIWVPTYTPPPGVPILSSPTLSSITTTTARPQVSITF